MSTWQGCGSVTLAAVLSMFDELLIHETLVRSVFFTFSGMFLFVSTSVWVERWSKCEKGWGKVKRRKELVREERSNAITRTNITYHQDKHHILTHLGIEQTFGLQ